MPKVRMIEEHDADEHVSRIYRDIKKSMNLSLVNSFLKTLAYYPDILDAYWQEVKPNLKTQFFAMAATRTQAVADSVSNSLFTFTDDYAWLNEHDYSREDMREIRYAVEMFHYSLSRMALLASHMKLSIDGADFSPASGRESDIQEPDFSGKVQLVPFESAPRDIEYIYRDIVDTTGMHIINKLYVVLAHWPGYLKHVWYDEVKPVVFTQDYKRESAKLQEIIRNISRQFPQPASDFIRHLNGDAKEQIPKIVAFFEKMLPGEMIVVGGIRNMLVEGERAARAARERLERSV